METNVNSCCKTARTLSLYKHLRLLFIVTITFTLLLPAHFESQAADSLLHTPIKNMKRNPAFMITPQELLNKINNSEEIALVDVRQKEDFEKIRIPGSLNMPLHVIKTKSFLKKKPLVIINRGNNYRSLESECERLITTYNFQEVFILAGGLSNWRDNSGELTGDYFAAEKLHDVSARHYFVDKDYDDWFIINVSTQASQEINYFFPISSHLPYSGNNETFQDKLREKVRTLTEISLPYILIVSDTGEEYGHVKKALHDSNITNVFYLEDGVSGYKSFTQKLALKFQPEKKSSKGCDVCP